MVAQLRIRIGVDCIAEARSGARQLVAQHQKTPLLLVLPQMEDIITEALKNAHHSDMDMGVQGVATGTGTYFHMELSSG